MTAKKYKELWPVIVSILLVAFDVIDILTYRNFLWLSVIWFAILYIKNAIRSANKMQALANFVRNKYPQIYAENSLRFQFDFSGNKRFDIGSKKIKEKIILLKIKQINQLTLRTFFSFVILLLDLIVLIASNHCYFME